MGMYGCTSWFFVQPTVQHDWKPFNNYQLAIYHPKNDSTVTHWIFTSYKTNQCIALFPLFKLTLISNVSAKGPRISVFFIFIFNHSIAAFFCSTHSLTWLKLFQQWLTCYTSPQITVLLICSFFPFKVTLISNGRTKGPRIV